jgi:hypothetical protein
MAEQALGAEEELSMMKKKPGKRLPTLPRAGLGYLAIHLRWTASCWPVSGLAETSPVVFPTVGTASDVRHKSGGLARQRSATSAYRCGGSAAWVDAREATTFLLPV